jgi:hypothetical protein
MTAIGVILTKVSPPKHSPTLPAMMRSAADIVLLVYEDDSRRPLTDEELAELREKLHQR